MMASSFGVLGMLLGPLSANSCAVAQAGGVIQPDQSPAKMQDVSPPAVVAWIGGETLDGEPFCLPEHSLVTSRYDPSPQERGTTRWCALVVLRSRPHGRAERSSSTP